MIHPATYENVREAVDRSFEIFAPQLSGKKVLIKPNVLRMSEIRESITTHPAVLRAVIDRVEAMTPASIIVGDNPGVFSYGDNELSFTKTGLMEAAKGYYRNIGNESRKIAFKQEYMDYISISEAVMDADFIISLPKFKTHGLTVVTGAIKNSYGFMPGAQKAMLHKAAGSPERFHELIVDIFMLRVPDLFIVDAITGMEGNGPASPDLREIGLLLASDNAVATDGVIATMMGCDPSKLRFLQKAKEAGLGDYDLKKIEILGELKIIPDFKLPPLGGDAAFKNANLQDIMQKRTLLRPEANPEWCTGCGECVEHCPVSALSMRDNVPKVETEACIVCFCCQEICPQKAITLK
jgi:uncharacterized protein (DUF362 family)/Pyruvate/2-oxoacid:ferredoxin oxidoreductase delta subunit